MVHKLRLPLLLASLFIYSGFALISCSSGGTMGAAFDKGYSQLISPDEGMIIHIDLERLNEKLDMEAITSHPSFETMLQIGGSGATSSFFKNLNTSGINMKAPVVMSISGVTENPRVRIYAELESEEALMAMLLEKEDQKVKKASGVNYVTVNSSTVCWDKGLVCFLSGFPTGQMEAEVAAAFTPKAVKDADTQFGGYQTFLSRKSDMHIWTSYKELLNEMPLEDGAAERILEGYEGSYNGYRLDFEKGNISIDMEMYSQNEELIESWRNAYKQKPDKELTEMIPPNTIALLNTYMDPEVLKRIYKGDISDLFSRTGLDKSGKVHELIEHFREAWAGDMMMAVTGLNSDNGKLAPDLVFGVSTKDEETLSKMLTDLSAKGFLAPSTSEISDSYLIRNFPFETTLTASGDKLIAIAGTPTVGDSNLESDIARHIKSSPMVFHVDIHALMDELSDAQGGMPMMMISGFVKSNFDYLLAYAVEPTDKEIVGAAHMDFKFVNEEDYSINVLATLLLDFFSTFGSMILQG